MKNVKSPLLFFNQLFDVFNMSLEWWFPSYYCWSSVQVGVCVKWLWREVVLSSDDESSQ